MFNVINFSAFKRVCIYLPDAHIANLLEVQLTAEGVPAKSTASFAEFERTMRDGRYTAIVTVSSCIGRIRMLTDMPIIDVRLLIEDWKKATHDQRLPAFETMTFLQGTCFVATRG